MPELRSRLAQPADAATIAAIHNQGIVDRVATFQTVPRDAETVARQLTAKGDRYPTVVVERDGQIVAWAGVSSYRETPWYAGIGEHSPVIRARILQACAWLGVSLDTVANERGDSCISSTGSKVSAWVVPTNEELMIARHTLALINSRKDGHVE